MVRRQTPFLPACPFLAGNTDADAPTDYEDGKPRKWHGFRQRSAKVAPKLMDVVRQAVENQKAPA
jgi:hypothetical protein